MIEVSEELYQTVVEPYKKRKGFGKLVVNLLEAYMSNESIYRYINGILDGYEDESNKDLLESLNAMADSLSMMGMYEEQIETTVNNGSRDMERIYTNGSDSRDEFKNTVRDAVNKDNPAEEKHQDSGLTKEDVVDIVHESMSGIEAMLKQIIANGHGTAPVVQEWVREEPEVAVAKEPIHLIVEEEVKSELVEETNNRVEAETIENKDSNEEADKAKNLLASLTGSLGAGW